MNRTNFNKQVKTRFELSEKVLIKKGSEYANEQNVFVNFERGVGLSFHNSPEKVAWEYCVKHLESIRSMLDHIETDGVNGFPNEELVREKFGDAINYMIIIEAMIMQRIENFNNSIDPFK
jgi:hypothetical protein